MRLVVGKFVLSRNVWHLRGSDAWGKACVRFYSDDKGKIKKKEVSLKTMSQTYNPDVTESKWYDFWESQGYFKPKDDGKVFTVLLPPPNLTGTLHLGHALTITVQDAFVRWMRMKGRNVVWIPGFDHAGIASQLVVEKYLQNKLNVTKYDLGKEEFLRNCSNWMSEREKDIVRQMRQMGASTDWSRKYYTMDDKNSQAVTKAFLHLHDKGLIYRCIELVNWSIQLRSVVPDIEIKWEEVNKPRKVRVPGYEKPIEFGRMYYIAYRLWDDGTQGDEVIVATTRPETFLGDTALAVNPNDTRYSHLANKYVWHPIRKCKIPIIFEESVDPKLGTGVLKVTPAHSIEDFEISKKHNLEVLDVFDSNGVVRNIEEFSNFVGAKRFDAREKVLHELMNRGLYKGARPHSMVIPFCSRSGDVIEYIKKSQWFLNTSGMNEKVRSAVEEGSLQIEPDYCTNLLLEWIRQGKDWNLSRQIWWGHQIPMYECEVGEEKIWVGATSSDDARLVASKKLSTNPDTLKVTQDPDVLDTWFSSGILPFSICGWPKELSASYPLGLMETGCDIISFWVSRMLMLGLEITGRLPFPKVILHGMVCDSYGRKMSKSLGNVILPEHVINGISLKEMNDEAKTSFANGLMTKSELKLNIEGQKKMFPSGIPKCGTDALRLGLCNDVIKADRVNFDINVVKGYNNFCNKIWQATIYLIRSIENKSGLTANINNDNLSLMDAWILSRLAKAVEKVDSGISDFRHHSAVDAVKIFFLKEFCAAYLESTKIVLKTGSEEDIRRVIAVLFTCLETSYRLLSPFMPFVTEELYHYLPRLDGFTPAESLTVAEFPDPKFWQRYDNPNVEDLVLTCLHIVHSIRTSKNLYKLNSQKVKVMVSCPVDLNNMFSDELTNFVKKQTAVDDFTRADGEMSQTNAIVLPVKNCTVYLYHEHTKRALQEMLAPMLLKENELKRNFETLKTKMSQPDYEDQTPSEMKKKNLVSFEKLTEKLKTIEEVREVIEKAQ